MGVNNTTLDAATPRIERDLNAKSFHAIVNELRSHTMAPPLNVRQRMLSLGLKPKSNERGVQVQDTQAFPPGVCEEVAAAASTAAYSERIGVKSMMMIMRVVILVVI